MASSPSGTRHPRGPGPLRLNEVEPSLVSEPKRSGRAPDGPFQEARLVGAPESELFEPPRQTRRVRVRRGNDVVEVVHAAGAGLILQPVEDPAPEAALLRIGPHREEDFRVAPGVVHPPVAEDPPVLLDPPPVAG